MPDPIDQNTTATPQSTLPDPQALVDAALDPAIANAAPTPESLPPMPSEAEPKIEEVTPPTDSSVANAPVVTAPVEPAPVTPPPSTANVAMGDETPLAFMTPPPSTTPETKTEPMPNLGTSAPLDAVPPAPTPAPEQVVKKGGKMKKAIGAVVGVFLLVVAVGLGGFYTYDRWGVGENLVAVIYGPNGRPSEIDNPGDCNGESNGGWLVWRDGECKVTGASGSDNPDKNTENPNDRTGEANTESQCGAAGGVWCDYGFCISETNTRGCKLEAIDRGYAVTYGANYAPANGGVCPDGYTAQDCVCGASQQKYCFDRTGVCGGSNDTPESTGYDQKTLDQGLCAITPAALTNDGIADHINDGADSNYCEDVFDTSLGCQDPGLPPNPNCFCGTTQVDTGHGFTSVTMKCGCGSADNPKHSVCNTTTKACQVVDGEGSDQCKIDADCITTTPIMACTGLAQAPVAPKVGDKVTFTCSGSITPSTAGTLSYKFRYSIGTGAVTSLANKTATTAELTIAACGDYKVECQTCATISGVLKCDPNWIGATP